MARILVVEDDPDTNDSLCEYLRGAGHELHAALDGEAAVAIFQRTPFDAIVLDIMLPKLSGLEILRLVRRTSDVPILMLTAVADEHTQLASFDQLADDYVTKPCSIALIGRRITALLRRSGKGLDVNQWTWRDLSIDFDNYATLRGGMPVEMTQKELQLLKFLLDNEGLVLTRAQILEDLWGLDSPESERTIDLYISRLRTKLGIDCIKTIRSIGYKIATNS